MRPIIIMDINTLPSEYKDTTLEEGIKNYEKVFNLKVIPFDPSRVNINYPASIDSAVRVVSLERWWQKIF